MSAGLPTTHDSSLGAMIPLAPAEAELPLEGVFPTRRFSVAEYERIGRAGILTEDDSVELLEGIIVQKTTKYPPHDGTIDVLSYFLHRQLPLNWYPRIQNVLITADSAPEPDVVVARGEPRRYMHHHPTASDVALVIEVADASIHRDRRKRKIYARAGVVQYWIVDLNAGQIEMYAEPESAAAEYQRKAVVALATTVSFSLPERGTITLPLYTVFQALDD